MSVAAHSRARAVLTAGLVAVLSSSVTACDSSGGPGGGANVGAGRGPGTAWEEPVAYSYTLTSTTQVLAGTFRVGVREGAVTSVEGLDGDSRRQAREVTGRVPTIGALLEMLRKARGEGADTAEAQYAADGHPVRITLDWSQNAVDDEALYVISSYRPAPGARG
ncbi:DUF6174 domain-containing protein [Streptomyces sp. NPDC006172]|uniref:DUF6174 domain-containing protein n=1 Tax=Streptomyces sp. NPDC006172 TaxID=3154470 RepID=UPI0033C8F019